MLFRSDRKSTRLNSSHTIISYAVFCLKKKTKHKNTGAIHAPRTPHVVGAPPGAHVAPESLSLSVAAQSFEVILYRHFFFFFLNNAPPPKISPFPHPAPFPI